jgi:hypothetical protein
VEILEINIKHARNNIYHGIINDCHIIKNTKVCGYILHVSAWSLRGGRHGNQGGERHGWTSGGNFGPILGQK